MSDWDELEAAAGRRTEEPAEEEREEEREAWDVEEAGMLPRRWVCIRRRPALFQHDPARYGYFDFALALTLRRWRCKRSSRLQHTRTQHNTISNTHTPPRCDQLTHLVCPLPFSSKTLYEALCIEQPAGTNDELAVWVRGDKETAVDDGDDDDDDDEAEGRGNEERSSTQRGPTLMPPFHYSWRPPQPEPRFAYVRSPPFNFCG